ncbi:Hypothetical predicted protein [Mytilus galloprovincialis]|uniref:Integrase catalytic domain-containing protein n=1 Tax=Mytilus galloprovincialis TaxID=29158 RepID=A0A8B6E7M2_MYTGA|nr:Hypothetical predicted protein [Mytilus galloprovincialis]
MKDYDLKTLKRWTEDKYEPTKAELKLCSEVVRHFWSLRQQIQIKDNILLYKWEDPISPRRLFMTPKQMQTELLHGCHDVVSSGHMGQYKTLEKLKQIAVWLNMTQSCKLYVKSYTACNLNKKSTRTARSKLGQYHAIFPMERVHMDILGPLPVTKTENLAVRLSSTQTKEKAYGNLVRQLCELLQIAETRTTPYHPSSNGQVERYNRTILQTIRCFIKSKQHNWDLFLQQLVGAVRATRNSQTGFSANMMMLGREVFQPIDVILSTSNWNADRKEVPQYIKDLVENLNRVHDIARDNLKASQERQKGIYDLKYNQNMYNVGDVVYKLNQATKVGQSAKLKSPWKGPYLITAWRSPVLYKIKDRKTESWIHHDRIKLCEDTELPIWIKRMRNQLMDQTMDEETNEIYECPIGLPDIFKENTNQIL